MSLGQVFDPRRNALTSWRLVLAIGVVFWHSWPLTGREIGYTPVARLLGDIFGLFTDEGVEVVGASLPG
ncbi:Putative acetyltransferase [Mycobacteroides abscessus]|nr:Putative acetyltransferase [Mycobacteroides abscessus]